MQLSSVPKGLLQLQTLIVTLQTTHCNYLDLLARRIPLCKPLTLQTPKQARMYVNRNIWLKFCLQNTMSPMPANVVSLAPRCRPVSTTCSQVKKATFTFLQSKSHKLISLLPSTLCTHQTTHNPKRANKQSSCTRTIHLVQYHGCAIERHDEFRLCTLKKCTKFFSSLTCTLVACKLPPPTHTHCTLVAGRLPPPRQPKHTLYTCCIRSHTLYVACKLTHKPRMTDRLTNIIIH